MAAPDRVEAARPRPSPAVIALAGIGGLAALVVLFATALLVMSAPTPLTFGEGFGDPFEELALAAGEAPLGAGTIGTSGELVVDVAGAVVRPGLHRLRAGDRVGDAIEAAGGFALRADLAVASQSLNLAELLVDGTKVLVPELGSESAVSVSSTDGRIDINNAGQSELESLPGIGPVTARKIMDARAERRFGTVRELRDRGVVGEAVYQDIESLVRAG